MDKPAHATTVMFMKRALLAMVAMVLTLSGCRADVATTLTVLSPSTAEIAVTATFDGEAGNSLRNNPKLREQVTTLFQNRLGIVPSVSDEDGVVTFTGTTQYEAVASTGGIIGIKSASLAQAPDNLTTLTVVTKAPKELTKAITDSVKNEPDAAGLQSTMLASTTLTLHVVFPGGIHSATWEHSGDVANVAYDDTTLTFARTLNTWQAGTLQVTGSTQGGPSIPGWVLPALIILAAVVAFTWINRRKF